MPNLSLKTRRRNARGISYRAQAAWGSRNFWGKTNRAEVSLLTGNAVVRYTSKSLGTSGNATTVRYVVAGASTPLSVSVVGSDITVNVATSGASAAVSTGREVRDAVNSSPTARLLVWADTRVVGSDGTGVVSAVAATNLAGGTATPAA